MKHICNICGKAINSNGYFFDLNPPLPSGEYWECNNCYNKRNPPNISKYDAKYQKERRKKRLMNAFIKLANGKPIQCTICGCPHIEALNFGHYNSDGAKHRREIGSNIAPWILNTPIKEVLSRIQIECIYCNSYHAYNGYYPPPKKQPKWDALIK